MRFKPSFWHPTAVVLSVVNVVGVGYAAGSAEPWHAGIHAGLALAFWSWSERLRRARHEVARPVEIDALEGEVSDLRRELAELQERLDFTERVLARGQEARRLDVER